MSPRSRPPVSDAERYRTLLEINNALISNLTREPLFGAIAAALHPVVPFDRTAIFLHDPQRDVLRLFVLESALPSSYFVVGHEIPATESHVGQVFQRGRPFVRHDLAREHHYPGESEALADGVRSYAIVPLVVRGRCLGTLAVASTRVGQYTDADVAFLQEVAGQVALAIENMTAYEQIATLTARLERENAYLQEEIHHEHDFAQMVGGSEALLAVLRRVDKVAPTDATVLVTGETGTGKELIARALHHQSGRRARPLVKVNCSAISAGLVESEFFGHAKGAFTGALERRIGRFQLADGGTIFLDEVGELPPETQVKLLRVLQEQEFEPVGSNQTVRIDVRVIAATNRDLGELVAAGKFREDLYYRLSVFPIEVPPLRQRGEDVVQLAQHFLDVTCKDFGRKPIKLTRSHVDAITGYGWPGNVRELKNVIERAVILSQGNVLRLDLALPEIALQGSGRRSRAEPARDDVLTEKELKALQKKNILTALKQSNWRVSGKGGAAELLGIRPTTLNDRIKTFGIKRPH